MTNSNDSSWNQDHQVAGSSTENGLSIKEEPLCEPLMRRDRSLKQIEFCARLQAKLEKCRSELAACRAQKDDLLNVNQDLEARLGISDEKLQQSIDELAEFKMNESFAEKMQKMAVQMQSKETKEIRAQLRKRETQIEAERKCHADLAAKLQTDNEKLTKQLEQSESSFKAEVEKILLKCKECEQAQESTNDLLTKKTEEAETLYSEVFKLKKQVRDVQNKTGRRSRENESLIGDLNASIQMLNQKLEEEENRKKQHEETISQLEKDLGSCKAKLQQKSAQGPETFILQKKIDEMKAGFNTKDEMHKKAVEELAQTMSKLKQEQTCKMQMEIQLKHRSDELVALQQKLDLSRENYKAKEKKCVEYYTTLNQQKKDIESMQKHVIEVSQRNAQLIQKIRTVGITVPQPAEAKENIAELKTESQKNENKDLAELEHKLDNCRRNYTTKVQKCAELEKNLAKARSKVLQLQQKLADSEAQISKLEMEKKFESANDDIFFGDMKKELNEAKMQAQEANNARNLICQSLKEILQKAMSPVSNRKRLLLEPEQELRAISASSKRSCADSTNISNMNEADNQSVTNGTSFKENTTDVQVFKTITGENHAAQFSENLLLYAARFMLPESNAEISNQANGSQPRHIKSEFDIPERDDKSLHEHIGGIYITYCLYFLQPAQYVMPIRMSTTQMESLHKYLAEVLLPEEQYEAMFCIFRLVRGNAFAVTPFETAYNPILYRRFDPAGSDPNMIEKDLQNIESGDDFTFLKELNSDTLISQIDSVHNAYMKAKAQRGLLDTNNKKLGLNLVKGNLCNFVANLLNETKKALEEQRQLKVRLPTTNSSQESDTNRRSKIRSDAYSQGLVHQRHRRHRMGHVDRNSESQDLVSPVKQEIRPSTSENPTTSSSPAKRRKSATSPEKRPKTRRPAAASSKSPTSKVRTGHTEVEADESDDAMKKKLNKLQAELLRMSSD